MPQISPFGPSWRGSLRELAYAINHIRRSKAFGRLSLRNTERLSVVHLYFKSGKLVQIVGNRGDDRAILLELREWTRGVGRFDRGTPPSLVEMGDVYEQLLDDVLLALRTHGLIAINEGPRIIEGGIDRDIRSKAAYHSLGVACVLIEATRRVSFAVAHLVGPKEAFSVLRDILDDCSSTFPAFTSLRIVPSGYLQVTDGSQLDRLPREDLLEGFAALFAICEYFCSPIIGEQNAHRLLVQALRDIAPALVSLGVFHLDIPRLSNR